MQLTKAITAKTLSASALLILTGCNEGDVVDRPARVYAVDDANITSDPSEQVIATDGSQQPHGNDQPQVSPNGSPPYSDSFVMRKDDSGRFVVEYHGIRFELTPTAPTWDGHFASAAGNDLDFDTGGHSVRVRTRVLTVNGQKFGHVSRGDTVIVTKERRTVRVNGQLRDALPMKFAVPGGVTFSLAGQIGNLKFSENGEGYFYDMLRRKCQVHQGVFLVDGDSFGAIREGDEVAISWDGAVKVNGKPRAGQNSVSESDATEDS